MNATLLAQIFLDAKVVDVDFSAWDQRVGLTVVALGMQSAPDGRLPVYHVDFAGVRRFDVAFGHYDRAPDFGHYQWLGDDYSLAAAGDFWQLRLSSSRNMPTLILVFGDVVAHRLDNYSLDTTFPGWNRPGAALLRPGVIAALAKRKG